MTHRPRPFSWTAPCLLALALGTAPGCALSAYLGYKLSPDYPRTEDASAVLPGLAAPVEVFFDPQGVPHVRAESERDLMLAAGYLQARERFFEMDMMRRIARGRVSELVGEQPLLGSTTVEFDMTMRGWGLDEGAEADAAELDSETRELLQAFVAGINAALERHTPLEYRLLRLTPEAWQLSDTFAVGRLTAWSVTHNWTQEMSRLLLALYLGPDRAEALYPSRPWDGAVSIELAAERHALPPAVVDEVRPLFPTEPRPGKAPAVPAPEGAAAWPVPGAFALGSNAWAVGGAHTRSGKPLLASDPHLTHLLPSMMMQLHLRCPAYDVIGITVPGLPYVLIGHNDRVAWGMTSAVADALDFYVEQPNPDNPEQVRTPDGFRPLERRELEVKVRQDGELKVRRFTLRRSRNGPLVQDLYPGRLPDWAPPVALHADARGAGAGLGLLRRSQSARTVTELHQVLSALSAPASIYTAADVDGGVALFACGRIPVREHHLGTFPVPGWLETYQWKRFSEPSELPTFLAGPEARLGHANGLIWDPHRAPFVFHIDSAPSYRYDRIVQLLAASAKHDTSTFAAIQRDVLMLRAERVLPALLQDIESLRPLDEREDEALGLLLAWDHRATAESPAAAIFWETYRLASASALRDELDAPAAEFVLAQRYSTHMMDGWFDDPQHPVWDDLATPERETRPVLVQAAFRQAVADLARRLGPQPRDWRWGKLHQLHAKHLMGGQEALADMVNLRRMALGGALDTVWKAHFDIGNPTEPYRVIAGPVFRMLADLSDLDRGWWVSDTGASGWPRSPHYGDQQPLWMRGEYAPMLYGWELVRQRAQGLLRLEPR